MNFFFIFKQLRNKRVKKQPAADLKAMHTTGSEGFSFLNQGRDGWILFEEDGKILKIYTEMSGVPQYDLLISFGNITSWTSPANEAIPAEKLLEVKKRLISWLTKNHMKSDLEV